MKFRGTFGAPVQLSKLVVLLGKLADSCVVHLTSDAVQFGIPSKDGVHIAAELSQRSLFLEHRIESRAENNRISFFVKLENLSRALKSCSSANAQKTQVKLTKKMGGPTLTFEIVLDGSQVQVLHDVPLRIVQDVEELHAYAEPEFATSLKCLSVVLPQAELRALRNVVERMKVFSDYIVLSASGDDQRQSAQLQLQVERDALVEISTTYTKLDVVQIHDDDGVIATGATPASPDRPGGEGGGSTTVEVKVDVKRLYKVLHSLIGSDIRIHSGICCILPDRALILKVFLPSGDGNSQSSSIVFYFPVLLS